MNKRRKRRRELKGVKERMGRGRRKEGRKVLKGRGEERKKGREETAKEK